MPLFGLQPIIARDRVRYVGEPVAIVLATDPSVAESAAEQVYLDIDELDPVLDSEEALAGDILIHSRRNQRHPRLGDRRRRHGGDLRRGRRRRLGALPRASPRRHAARDARPGRRGRGRRPAHRLGPRQGEALQPHCGCVGPRARARARPVHRARRRRSIRRPRRALSGGLPDPLGRDEARPAREVDRGPGRVADRPQPLAGADDRPRGRGRRRRPAACLPRPEPLQHGRVYAHERRSSRRCCARCRSTARTAGGGFQVERSEC